MIVRRAETTTTARLLVTVTDRTPAATAASQVGLRADDGPTWAWCCTPRARDSPAVAGPGVENAGPNPHDGDAVAIAAPKTHKWSRLAIPSAPTRGDAETRHAPRPFVRRSRRLAFRAASGGRSARTGFPGDQRTGPAHGTSAPGPAHGTSAQGPAHRGPARDQRSGASAQGSSVNLTAPGSGGIAHGRSVPGGDRDPCLDAGDPASDVPGGEAFGHERQERQQLVDRDGLPRRDHSRLRRSGGSRLGRRRRRRLAQASLFRTNWPL